MKIALLDPYFDESHQQWAQDLKKYSKHDIDFYVRPRFYWKWKMAGGALELADDINESLTCYDLLLATDMVNVPLLKSRLSTKNQSTKIALYFHENQITYPWSSTDPDLVKARDHHYGLINFYSALTVEAVYFNSAYHKKSFIEALPTFLGNFPKFTPDAYIKEIKVKSKVLPIGLNMGESSQQREKNKIPVIIWNHRWEEDKNPVGFYQVLKKAKDAGFRFKLVVVGKSFRRRPEAFKMMEEAFKEEIIQFGFVESKEKYYEYLEMSDILLVTSNQDFFGISVVEGISYGCLPILPNRLAYPEHVPAQRHSQYFYNSDEELYDMLARALIQTSQPEPQLIEYVNKYDWSNLKSTYDQEFENVVMETT